MGARLRALDWARLGLGYPRSWPIALRSALSICLSSNFPTCVYWGPELRLLYNDAWSLIPAERHPWALGRPAREVWADIWHVIEPQFRHVLDTGQGFSSYDQFLPMQRHGRIEETWWTYSLTPLFDEHEHVVGVLNQGHETTSAVLTERARIDEVARLRELFELAPAAVALLGGRQHVVEMANPACMRLVGSRDILGKPIAEALPELVDQGFIELLDRAFINAETYKGEAVRMRLRRTPSELLEERILDFVYQPVRDPTGKSTGILVQATDVTERDRALQQLRDADKRKDVFLATLAHELRNPLAPIANGLQIIKLATGGDARVLRTREMMERQLEHLVHLVDDLMDTSRISTGKIQLQHERVKLAEVLARAVESTRGQFEQQAQTLQVSVGDAELAVDGDAERLTQVFANLLGNASKFTPAQGHIVLAMRREASTALITVEDDGIGIPPEALRQVFELFEQLPACGTHSVGLGIGLALVSQLVQMHGGSVAAFSNGQGQGSRFTVTLPLAAGEPQCAKTDDTPAATPGPPVRHRRILIVDDNADAAESLAALFQFEGHEVAIVGSGAEAIEAFLHTTPEIVFMDLGMSGMDGFETSRRIRQLPGGDAVHIAALTGWGQEGDRERTRAAGMDLHLVKPVNLQALHRALEGLP